MPLNIRSETEKKSTVSFNMMMTTMTAFVPSIAISVTYHHQQSLKPLTRTSISQFPTAYPAHIHIRNSKSSNQTTRTTTMAASSTTTTEGNNDLLIIGAGVLGRIIAQEWRKYHPDALITGETRSDKSHAELASNLIIPALSGTTSPTPPFVVFCAPPSGSPNYALTLKQTVQRAKSTSSRLIFTSSGSVHGSLVTEISETTEQDVSTERSKSLSEAENHVLNYENGIVIRLSGLYTLHRGAHSYWLRNGVAKYGKHRWLNLIHYEDAARAVINTFLVKDEDLSNWPRRNLLACANMPITPLEICEVSKKHPDFKSFDLPVFDGPSPQRKYDNQWTRSVIDWKPKWESFVTFMEDEISLIEQQQNQK